MYAEKLEEIPTATTHIISNRGYEQVLLEQLQQAGKGSIVRLAHYETIADPIGKPILELIRVAAENGADIGFVVDHYPQYGDDLRGPTIKAITAIKKAGGNVIVHGTHFRGIRRSHEKLAYFSDPDGNEVAVITSANITQDNLTVWPEVGIVVHGGDLPGMVVGYVDTILQGNEPDGQILPLPNDLQTVFMLDGKTPVIQKELLALISQAESGVILGPYVGWRTFEAIRLRARKGADITVVVPSKNNSSIYQTYHQIWTNEMTQGGMDPRNVLFYVGHEGNGMFHAKVAQFMLPGGIVVSIVSSHNWNQESYLAGKNKESALKSNNLHLYHDVSRQTAPIRAQTVSLAEIQRNRRTYALT